MKVEDKEKGFDCLRWARQTRERISAEIQDMSPEELELWLEARRPTDPFLASLFDRRRAPKGGRFLPEASD